MDCLISIDFNMKFLRLGKGEGLDHMTIIGHMIIKLIYSWTIHELFMNKCSWTIPELFMYHFFKFHEQIMNYSSRTIHEL